MLHFFKKCGKIKLMNSRHRSISNDSLRLNAIIFSALTFADTIKNFFTDSVSFLK